MCIYIYLYLHIFIVVHTYSKYMTYAMNKICRYMIYAKKKCSRILGSLCHSYHTNYKLTKFRYIYIDPKRVYYWSSSTSPKILNKKPRLLRNYVPDALLQKMTHGESNVSTVSRDETRSRQTPRMLPVQRIQHVQRIKVRTGLVDPGWYLMGHLR